MSPLRRSRPFWRRAGSKESSILAFFLLSPPENPLIPLTLSIEGFTFKSFTPSTSLGRVFLLREGVDRAF